MVLPVILIALVCGFGASELQAESVDSGVIRLRTTPADPTDPSNQVEDALGQARRGFDYDTFEARLESLWFQRKTLLADGREADAARTAELIRAFCAEERVSRLDYLAGALISEARRDSENGNYSEALDSLAFAGSFDPGRPQVHLARAVVYWKSGHGYFAAAGEIASALKSSLLRSVRDLSLFNQLALVMVVALMACLVVFSILMVLRYQVAFRHEIEEWLGQHLPEGAARWAGWGGLFLPFLLWIGTGWFALYWIIITTRFMRTREWAVAAVLMIGCVLAVPGYRLAVNLYSMTADPLVRTTLASAEGEYDPDRIVKLRRLVRAYPDNPTYHFLLAGLYKGGRYFEEAFTEYKDALRLDLELYQAHINIGNIFYITGQHHEAVANYGRALDVEPDSVLAHFNMHLAQSELFQFKQADESLGQARDISPKRVAELLSGAGQRGNRPAVRDSLLDMTSVWEAAIGGRSARQALQSGAETVSASVRLREFLNPIGIVALLSLALSGAAYRSTRNHPPALRCIRCGRPFCHFCKSGREGREYCSQCMHLFVRGDGLAPGAKNRKLYEVECYERRARQSRKLISLVLPGAGHVLRGQAAAGCLLLLGWFAGLIAWQPTLLIPVQWLAGIDLRLDLIRAGSVPAMYSVNSFALLAMGVVALVWLAGNVNLWRKGQQA